MRSQSCDDKILVREIAKLKVIGSRVYPIQVAVWIRYTFIMEEG